MNQSNTSPGTPFTPPVSRIPGDASPQVRWEITVGLAFAVAILTPFMLGVCGCTMFSIATFFMVLGTSLWVGNGTFGALTVEREKKTLDCLRLTQLTTNEVLLLKIQPELTRLLTLLAVLSPTVVAVGIWGDQGVVVTFGAIVIAALAGLLATLGGLFVSSVCASTSQAVVTGWVARGVWLLLTPLFDLVVGAVFLQPTPPPVFTSVNPLAALASLDVPEAFSGLHAWLPALYIAAVPVICAILWAATAARFNRGLVGGGGLSDTEVHPVYRAGAQTFVTRLLPSLASNPSFLREMVGQLRAGAGRWPGYLVFVVLLIAPSFYSHFWTLNDLKTSRERGAKIRSTAFIHTTDAKATREAAPKEGTLALYVAPTSAPNDYTSAYETTVVVEGHTSIACLRLMLLESYGVSLPKGSLKFYTSPRNQTAQPAMVEQRQPDAGTARALGLDTPAKPVSKITPTQAAAASQTSLHVGLTGAIVLLLLYLSMRFSAFLATAVTGERSRRTWEDLALTGISCDEAMFGKLMGAITLPLTQMTVAFPVLVIFVCTGGLTSFEVLSLYIYALSVAAAAAALGLWASAVSRTSHDAHLLGLTIVLASFFAAPVLLPLVLAGGFLYGSMSAMASGSSPVRRVAALGLTFCLYASLGAGSPVTAVLSFMPSLTAGSRFLADLGIVSHDPFVSFVHLVAATGVMVSLTLLLWSATMQRLSNHTSKGLTAEVLDPAA